MMINPTKKKLMVCFPYGFFNKTIASREDVYKIVSGPAYKDMTPRHLKGIGNYVKEKEVIFNSITDRIMEYFSQPAKDKKEFDCWHKNMCEDICRKFSVLPNIELKYGKAQKLLNITFKHLYCFADSESKSEYFKYCHIPVDSNIIDWCKKNCGITPPPTAWSFMSYGDYTAFEEKLHSWLNSDANTDNRDENGIPYTLLQMDFIAWISEPKTRKGIIEKWQEIQYKNDLFETAVSVFPELKKQ